LWQIKNYTFISRYSLFCELYAIAFFSASRRALIALLILLIEKIKDNKDTWPKLKKKKKEKIFFFLLFHK